MSDSLAPQPAALTLTCRSEIDTRALGAALARAILPLLTARASAVVLCLAGPLGAGKTTLVRGLLAELGVAGPVRSPSYALLECYDTPKCRAVHVDLYRMNEPQEIEALGLRDFDRAGSVWLIEWPERAGSLLPVPDVSLRLSIAADAHHVKCVGESADGFRILASLPRAA